MTAEIAAPVATADAARVLTDQIKRGVEGVWQLITGVHDPRVGCFGLLDMG